MSTKEGGMVVNCWDSAESKRIKKWTEKNESSCLKSFVVRDVGGQRRNNAFVRASQCL